MQTIEKIKDGAALEEDASSTNVVLVPSPTPPSVCPTESSAASTGLGAGAELFSDPCSEADSDVDSTEDLLGESTQWVEVGTRLGRVFHNLASAHGDDLEDEDDWDSFSQGLRDGEAQFRSVLGSKVNRCSSPGRPLHSGCDLGRALLEHYEVFGAPSGSWRRAAPRQAVPGAVASEDEDFEQQEDDYKASRRAQQEVDTQGISFKSRQCPRTVNLEWTDLGHRIARVLHDTESDEDGA